MIKNNIQSKLIFLINILIIFLFFTISVNTSEQNAKDGLITFGKNNAPIKIKVFSLF